MNHSKDDKKFLLDLMIAGDRELSDFLQTRPNDEELGESLDFFKQYLMENGGLTEKRSKEIQSCHIHYLSRLLSSDLPIKSIYQLLSIIGKDLNTRRRFACYFLYSIKVSLSYIWSTHFSISPLR